MIKVIYLLFNKIQYISLHTLHLELVWNEDEKGRM